MRVAYIGNFKPPYSTENYVKKTLEDMGHSVECLQEDAFPLNVDPNHALVIWTRTWPNLAVNHFIDLSKRRGIPTVSLHYDLYVGISRESAMDNDRFWHTDYVFSTDGDPHSLEVFKQKGINHYWLPAGIYKGHAKRGKFRPEYASDVLFVGTVWDYHPEWPYRFELYTFLKETYGNKFMHVGGGGKFNLRGPDLNDLYASAKVVVGDALCKNFKHENYWSDRLYETTGRGGFLIHPEIKGIQSQFSSPYEFITYPYGNFGHLKAVIDFYTKEDHIRKLVTARAIKRVRSEHTMEHRMQKVLDIVNGKETS